MIIAHAAKPDSRAAEQLAFLASWAMQHATTAADTPIDQHED